MLLAPALLAAIAIAGWPLARTATLAFTDARLGELDAAGWVGLENFAWLLRDPQWWVSVRNTVVFTLVSVSLELALGMGFALLLGAGLRGQAILRAVALVPWAVPTVVSAQLWAWMFHDAYGVINDLCLRAHLIEAPVAWLAEPSSALAAAILADVWKTTPFVTLLLLAGLQGIPTEVYAAAALDGAGAWRRFVHITLPLLTPALAVAAVFRSLDALRVFDLVYIMTGNAEASATVSVYARRHLIDFQDAGYGSAASFAVVVLASIASVALVLWLRPFERGPR